MERERMRVFRLAFVTKLVSEFSQSFKDTEAEKDPEEICILFSLFGCQSRQ